MKNTMKISELREALRIRGQPASRAFISACMNGRTVRVRHNGRVKYQYQFPPILSDGEDFRRTANGIEFYPTAIQKISTRKISTREKKQ